MVTFATIRLITGHVSYLNKKQDQQSCKMKFGSWTYDGWAVDLKPIRGYVDDNTEIKTGMDLSEYYPSIEWDILQVNFVTHVQVWHSHTARGMKH